MENIFLIVICLFGGVLLRHLKLAPKNAYVGLNSYVINIALPALSLYFISSLEFSTNLLFPVFVAWILVLLSWVTFSVIGRIYKWPDKLIGCLVLTTGFANTSFLGFPVIEAFYGEEGLSEAIIVDQVGSFMALSTIGLFIAEKYAHKDQSKTNIIKRLISFPPFIAFTIALILNLSNISIEENLSLVFKNLGSTLVPVALVSVGLQWKIKRRTALFPYLVVGSIAKLLVFPLIILLIYFLFGAQGLTGKVSVMEAAMPSMITASILAVNYNLKKELANMMVGVGLLAAVILLPLWYLLLEQIF